MDLKIQSSNLELKDNIDQANTEVGPEYPYSQVRQNQWITCGMELCWPWENITVLFVFTFIPSTLITRGTKYRGALSSNPCQFLQWHIIILLNQKWQGKPCATVWKTQSEIHYCMHGCSGFLQLWLCSKMVVLLGKKGHLESHHMQGQLTLYSSK